MPTATKTPVKYDLYPAQHAFVADQRRWTALIAGRGAGKTYCGAIKALVHADKPGHGLIVAPTYVMLRDVDWVACQMLWKPWIKSSNQTAMTIELATGHQVLFRSADTADRLRGLTVSWAWIDEAALVDRATWDIVLGTLREHGKSGPAWVTSTPRGFNWVYDVFVTGQSADTGLHRSTTLDNPFVDSAFEAALRQQYSTEFARQELAGEFLVLGAGLFKPDWWQRYEHFDRSQAQRVIQVWDTAFSEKTSADYSVCATWAQTATGYLVLDVWRRQVGFPELKRAAKDLYEQWRPAEVLVEDEASGQSMLQELRRDTRMPVIPLKVGTDKVSRANAVTATVEAGRVALPEHAPWVRDFIEEHAGFPNVAHDDQVDTTSMALARLVQHVPAAPVLNITRSSPWGQRVSA